MFMSTRQLQLYARQWPSSPASYALPFCFGTRWPSMCCPRFPIVVLRQEGRRGLMLWEDDEDYFHVRKVSCVDGAWPSPAAPAAVYLKDRLTELCAIARQTNRI